MVRSWMILSMAVVMAAGLGGCRSAAAGTTKNYLLVVDEIMTKAPVAPARAVTVWNVSLPGYLDRRELVRIVDGDQVTTLPQHQWAEGFSACLKRALEDNLKHQLGADKVVLQSQSQTARGEEAPCRLLFDFRHFELVDENTLSMEVAVSAVCGTAVRRKSFSYTGMHVDLMHPAKAYSQTVAVLVREMVEWLAASESETGKSN